MIDGKILGQKEIYIVEWDDIMSIYANNASTTANGPTTGSESYEARQSIILFDYILYPIMVAYNAGKIVLLRRTFPLQYFFLIKCPEIGIIRSNSYRFVFAHHDYTIYDLSTEYLDIWNTTSGLTDTPQCRITCTERKLYSPQRNTFTINAASWTYDSTAEIYYYTPTFDNFMILSYEANVSVWYNMDLNRFESLEKALVTISYYPFNEITLIKTWEFF